MRSSSYNIVAFAFAFAFAVSRPASSFVAPERAPRSGGIIVGIRALDASSPPRDDIIPGGGTTTTTTAATTTTTD